MLGERLAPVHVDEPRPPRVEEELLAVAGGTTTRANYNYAVGGYRTDQCLTVWRNNVRGRGFSTLVLGCGVNSAIQGNPATSALAWADLQTILSEAKADGMTVVPLTILPFGSNANWSAPRQTFITGELDIHDVGLLSDGRIVFVNTLYNCLATTSERHSFTPLWAPPFISKIVKEDRCHLNGLALHEGVARFVTAVSRSDTIDGWRDRRAHGGVVVDVQSGEVVVDGLSMPHSPRMHRGKLWLLNSGTGELGWIEPARAARGAQFHAVAFCPGFVRGLAFFDDYAFVGLSKPRYQRFEGLELDRKLAEADSEPWCGVQVIDLRGGTCAHWFRIDGSVTELYDVAVVPGNVRPMAIGFANNEIMEFITHEEQHLPLPDGYRHLPPIQRAVSD